MAKQDLLLSQVQRGLNGYKHLCDLLGMDPAYDFVIAHETFCSGVAALYYTNHIKTKPLKILDIVEYPVYSQRSTSHIRKVGLANPYSDSLTYDFAVNIANKFDYCFATSAGQVGVYKNNGCTAEIDLLLNCRISDEVPVASAPYLSGKYSFDRSDIILVYPNRAYEYCGLEAALKALSLLDDRFKLVVLGELVDDLLHSVNDLVTTLGLKERFFVTGMLDPAMILPILSEADVALVLLEPVVDNHRHSLPNRLFDALATHTPVVAFADTEVGEFVEHHQIGVMAELGDPRLLSNAIKQAVTRNIYYKNKMKEMASHYTWPKQFEKVSGLIQAGSNVNPRVLLVALKDIQRNDRVKRMANSLIGLGCRVDVVAKTLPLRSMAVGGVSYFRTDK